MGAADAAFVALLCLGAALVVLNTRGFTIFYADEWDFVLDRPGLSPHTLLSPHGPHLSLVPLLVFKVLITVFGGHSYLPFRLLAAFDMVIVALALGIGCRRLWGRWWGLAPVALIVCLGPGGATTLWAFQDGYAIAVAAGIGALLCLDSGSRRSDRWACLWLTLSLASASQGIGFIGGAAVMLFWRRDGWRRAWVVLVPAILYGLWYLGYGRQDSQTHLSLWTKVPGYVTSALASTVDGAIGLGPAASRYPSVGGLFIVAALAAAVVLVFAVSRGHRPDGLFWGTAITLLVIWTAAAVSNTAAFYRPPDAARYLWSDTAILCLALAALLPRPRLSRRATALACLVLLVVIAADLPAYGSQRRAMVSADQTERAELSALELARGVAHPDYSPAGLADVHRPALLYRAAPADDLPLETAAQLARLPSPLRNQADAVLRGAELTVSRSATSASAAVAPASGCQALGATPVRRAVSAATLVLRAPAHGRLTLAARRFGLSAPTVTSVSDGATVTVRFPADRAPSHPWTVIARGNGGRVCRT